MSKAATDRAGGTGTLGILGGAFDPVHNGHLRLAVELQEVLELDEVRLVPTGQPPHREPAVASAEQRFLLCRAAVKGESNMQADDCEILRDGPSYAFETLRQFREEYPDKSIVWLMGSDAFANLNKWHRSAELLELAHLVVVHRPGESVSEESLSAWGKYEIEQPTDLHRKPAGDILFHSMTLLDISSTQIRDCLRHQRSIRYLVPDSVCALIEVWGLYLNRGASSS